LMQRARGREGAAKGGCPPGGAHEGVEGRVPDVVLLPEPHRWAGGGGPGEGEGAWKERRGLL